MSTKVQGYVAFRPGPPTGRARIVEDTYRNVVLFKTEEAAQRAAGGGSVAPVVRATRQPGLRKPRTDE